MTELFSAEEFKYLFKMDSISMTFFCSSYTFQAADYRLLALLLYIGYSPYIYKLCCILYYIYIV